MSELSKVGKKVLVPISLEDFRKAEKAGVTSFPARAIEYSTIEYERNGNVRELALIDCEVNGVGLATGLASITMLKLIAEGDKKLNLIFTGERLNPRTNVNMPTFDLKIAI